MSNYSKDVFFEPWANHSYNKGINFDKKGNLCLGTNNGKFYKVMVLGCNHYCEERKKCEECIAKNNNPNENCTMRLNENKDCGKLSYCKGYTKKVIEDIMDVIWISESHNRFYKACVDNSKSEQFDKLEKAFKKAKKDKDEIKISDIRNKMKPELNIWNYLVFSNFFQRSMPYREETSNEEYLQDPTEQEKGAKAFIEIFRQYKPDIIITWGNYVIGSLHNNEKILNENKLHFRISHDKTPKIEIMGYEHPISFNILDWTVRRKKGSSLIIESWHPAAKEFKPSEIHRSIVFAFNNYDRLIKAHKDLHDPKFKCEISRNKKNPDEDIWRNEDDFQLR